MNDSFEAPRIKQEELWEMPPEQFNKWRDENDFTRILDYFKKRMFLFKDWQKEFNITDEDLIDLGISKLISNGNTAKYLIITTDKSGDIYRYDSPVEFIVESVYGKPPKNLFTVKESKYFVPYFKWFRENKLYKKISFRPYYPIITSVSSYVSPEYSRSTFFGGLGILKLGGIKNDFNYSFEGRKLQFVDLDFLNLSGDNFGSQLKDIEFATARFWKMNNVEAHFFKYFHTNLEGSEINNSKLDRFEFINCGGYDVKISDSILMRCRFGKGGFVPYFNNVDLRDSDIVSDYIKDNDPDNAASSELMKRLKNSFASRGQMSKAGKFYYFERRLEERTFFNQAKHHFKNILKMPDTKIVKKRILNFRLPFIHLTSFISNISKYLSSKIQLCFWGYGEKPSRIILITFFELLTGAFILYFNSTHSSLNIGDSFYYSVLSFTAMSDPSFLLNGYTRIVVAAIALIGLFNTGFLIAGFSSKQKY